MSSHDSPRSAKAQLAAYIISVNKLTAGRDKIYRVAQYFCRFLHAYLLARGYPPTSNGMIRLKLLLNHLSLGRKLMRLGKSIDHYVDAQRSWQTEPDPVMRQLSTIDNLNKCLRMVFDHVQWAQGVGLIKSEAVARLSNLANFFWLCGLLTSIYKTTILLERDAADPAKDNLEEDRRRRRALLLGLARDMFDVPIPARALGVPGLSEAFVGLSGTVSSAIGLYEVSRKVFR